MRQFSYSQSILLAVFYPQGTVTYSMKIHTHDIFLGERPNFLELLQSLQDHRWFPTLWQLELSLKL